MRYRKFVSVTRKFGAMESSNSLLYHLVDFEDWLSIFAHYQSTHSHCSETFVATIGCQKEVVHTLWCKYFVGTLFTPRDLLWTLSFLNIYPKSDIVMAAFWSVHKNTYFEHVWPCFDYLCKELNEVLVFCPFLKLRFILKSDGNKFQKVVFMHMSLWQLILQNVQ